MSKKLLKAAPFPFIGQKRMFAKHYIQVLEDNIPNDGEGWTIVDAFGGSGLLSHIAKRIKPKARVIFNDFDNYAEQVINISDINRLRSIISALVTHIPRKKKIDNKTKLNIIQQIKQFNGYKSPHILSAWLLFSGNQVKTFDELYQKDFFNGVRQSDYPECSDYLQGVEIRQESFETLLPEFKQDKKALFVLDPPYLCTKQESYKQATYFDLVSFLELIEQVRPPFIFFSSTKSELLTFLNWSAKKKKNNYLAFQNTALIQIDAVMNRGTKYQDNLLYKFH